MFEDAVLCHAIARADLSLARNARSLHSPYLLSPTSRIGSIITLAVVLWTFDIQGAEERMFVSYHQSSVGKIVVRKLSFSL